MIRSFIVTFLLVLCATALLFSHGKTQASRNQKWKSLFNGQSLDGWCTPDVSFFSVEDGAITGTVTSDHKPKETLFLTYQSGDFGDFEMHFEFRIFGPKANSGMQFRSKVIERGQVQGYQADIALAGPYTGGIWDEFSSRNSLAAPGFTSTFDEAGKKTTAPIPGVDVFLKKLNIGKWTRYNITAQAEHIILRINGQVVADLTDRDAKNAAKRGVFAVAVIAEPMKVQFKNIRVKQL